MKKYNNFTEWFTELKEIYNSDGSPDSLFPTWPFKRSEWLDYYNQQKTPLEALSIEFGENN